MKRDEKINRLSHWWREVEAHSHDDEQLQRKLHLMEAELRHVLRERAGGSPQWKRNLAATTVLVAVIALAVGMLRFFGVPDMSRSGLEAAATVAARSDVAFVKAASSLPAGEATTAYAPPASKADERRPRIKRVAQSRTPARATTTPPKEVAPAAKEAVPATAPSPTPSEAPDTAGRSEPGLDALALLSAFESEFEE